MTSNAIADHASPKTASNALLIGVEDSTSRFTCPACAGALSEGTSRCPACGARLIMGVMARRAGAILGLGIVVGALIGGVITASAFSVSLRASEAARGASLATAPPQVLPTTAPVTRGPVPVVGPQQAALAALSGTAVVNGRIASDGAALSATLATTDVTSNAISRALRTLAADASVGLDLTGRLRPWADAGSVSTDLDTFYRSIATTARAGLRVSFADTASYQRAGAQMLLVLRGLDEVDASTRTLAGTVDLELPPLVVPEAAGQVPAGVSTP